MLQNELFSPYGEIGRRRYAIVGFVLFAIKFTVDRYFSIFFSARGWLPYTELFLFGRFNIPKNVTDKALYNLILVLTLISIPFIYAGLVLTLKRLRSVNAPLWLICLFFIPYLNLFFFTLLSITPERTSIRPDTGNIIENYLRWIIPKDKAGCAAFGIGISAAIGTALVLFTTFFLKIYGGGLFIGLPFMMGFISALIYSYHEPRSRTECTSVALMSVSILGFLINPARMIFVKNHEYSRACEPFAKAKASRKR